MEPAQSTEPLPSTSKAARWATLLACLIAILGIWLVALPAVARIESVAAQMRYFESLGIDPSARFYTEQPAGWRAIRIMEDRMRQSPDAFWNFRQYPEQRADGSTGSVPESSN